MSHDANTYLAEDCVHWSIGDAIADVPEISRGSTAVKLKR